MTYLGIILLLLILFFLSVVETAVIRLSRLTLRILAKRGSSLDPDLAGILNSDRSRFLLPVRFAVQLVQVTLVVVTIRIFLIPKLDQVFWWGFAILLLTFWIMALILPMMVTRNPEQTLLRLTPVLSRVYPFMSWCCRPLASFLGHLERPHNRSEDIEDQEEESTEDEFEAYVDVGEEEGIIEGQEGDLIMSALEFGNTRVKEIMTPRTQVVATSESTTISEIRDLIVSRKHSRIPVYRNGLDDIVGIIYVRNLLAYLNADSSDTSVASLMKKPLFIPETKKLADLLGEMQKSAQHVAIVINEYGAVSGLVSIEDLLEEIVGEIHDEDEFQQEDLVHEGEGSYIVRGTAEIENVETTLGLDLGETHFTTISGFVVAQMGKIPQSGETITIKGIQVEILATDQRKINTLRIRLANS